MRLVLLFSLGVSPAATGHAGLLIWLELPSLARALILLCTMWVRALNILLQVVAVDGLPQVQASLLQKALLGLLYRGAIEDFIRLLVVREHLFKLLVDLLV